MGARRSAVGLAALALLAFGVLFGAASPGGATGPAVTFSLECSPEILTAGDAWGCSGTIANAGPRTVEHVRLFEQVAGATLVASQFSARARCVPLLQGGTACAFGKLRRGQSITFTTVFGTSPSSTGTLSNLAYVTFESANDRNKVLCANTNTPPPCGSQESTELVESGNPDLAGGFVAFAGDDTLATADHELTGTQNVLTHAEIPYRADLFPIGFGATIVERDETFTGELCAEELTCFGQIVEESFPGAFSTSEPLRVTFQVLEPEDGESLLLSESETLNVFKDGQAALDCAESPLSTTVGFCVDSVSFVEVAGGHLFTVVAKSTGNGSWRFG